MKINIHLLFQFICYYSIKIKHIKINNSQTQHDL